MINHYGRLIMRYDNLKTLSGSQFRRVTGVKRTTFNKMVEIVIEADKIKKVQGGRPNNLAVEYRILMTLEHLREYRTYLHIATSYGLSESSAFKKYPLDRRCIGKLQRIQASR